MLSLPNFSKNHRNFRRARHHIVSLKFFAILAVTFSQIFMTPIQHRLFYERSFPTEHTQIPYLHYPHTTNITLCPSVAAAAALSAVVGAEALIVLVLLGVLFVVVVAPGVLRPQPVPSSPTDAPSRPSAPRSRSSARLSPRGLIRPVKLSPSPPVTATRPRDPVASILARITRSGSTAVASS